jgi:integrase
MAKVNVRKETGKLVIDFTYRGVRCREQTALDDSAANRKRAEAVLRKLREAVSAGTFVYREFFPGSALAARFEGLADVGVQVPGAPQPISVVAAASAAVATATPTFRDFVTSWLAEHQIEWRHSHIKVLNSTLNGHLLPAFGDKPVGTITKSDVLNFRAKLGEKPGRTGDKLSAKRINNILAVMRQVMADAADTHRFVSPFSNVKPLKIRKVDIRPFTLEEVDRILKTVRKDWHDYLQVRFLTGMRTGEVNGLKWKYVDFVRRLILIRETFVLGRVEYTKTDSSQRDVQMSQPVYEALKRQWEVSGKLGEYVFCNREGHPIDNKNFSDRVWYPLLRHLGLEERRPYQMRHTAATLWLASGENPQWISNQLGHANSQMLFTVYGRFVPNMTRQDGSAMDRLLATRFATTNVAPSPAAATPANDREPPPAGTTRSA